MAAPVSPDSYTPYLNHEFVLHHQGQAHALTLSKVETTIDNAEQLCFSLMFQGPADRVPQGIHRLSHPQLGDIDLFLVPILQKRGGPCFQAVFNLVKDEGQ